MHPLKKYGGSKVLDLEKSTENKIKNGNSNRTSFISELFSWIKAIVTAGIIALIVNNFVIVNAMVPTGSMESTIMTNDRIIAFRLSYLFNSPSRFDIVVFRNPDDESVLYIKRIIGMPGETLMIANGRVYIDGERLYEDDEFIKDNFFGTFGPFVIGEDEYFVLGDNRNNSEDSRAWDNPFVGRNAILGRAIFKYFRGFEILR
ncbi:MAG: signal peptidase I [Defluviitaleaceae bacterium]|nr:signal peptidase I [Defluviitaleaceae bacterium]